jgi:hypothetical protein
MAEFVELSIRLERLARHATAYQNYLGETQLTTPERLPFVEYDGAIPHICKGDEYLQDIANLYFRNLIDYPVDIAEIIAQYQEDPILDLSIPLSTNRVISVPPLSYIMEVAYGESLADNPKLV